MARAEARGVARLGQAPGVVDVGAQARERRARGAPHHRPRVREALPAPKRGREVAYRSAAPCPSRPRPGRRTSRCAAAAVEGQRRGPPTAARAGPRAARPRGTRCRLHAKPAQIASLSPPPGSWHDVHPGARPTRCAGRVAGDETRPLGGDRLRRRRRRCRRRSRTEVGATRSRPRGRGGTCRGVGVLDGDDDVPAGGVDRSGYGGTRREAVDMLAHIVPLAAPVLDTAPSGGQDEGQPRHRESHDQEDVTP